MGACLESTLRFLKTNSKEYSEAIVEMIRWHTGLILAGGVSWKQADTIRVRIVGLLFVHNLLAFYSFAQRSTCILI